MDIIMNDILKRSNIFFCMIYHSVPSMSLCDIYPTIHA